jgi:CHAT domain
LVLVPDGLRDAFEHALDAVPPDEAARLRLFANAAPGREDLLTLSRTLEGTRFSSDLGMDLRYVRLLARKALDNLVRDADAEGALLAIEFLATHAVKPGRAEGAVEITRREGVLEELRASTEARVLETADERVRSSLATLLVQLNASDGPKDPTTISQLIDTPEVLNDVVGTLGYNNTDVHALALSSRGRLIRVSSRGGNPFAPVEEEASVFDNAKLEQWRKEHPFCYCGPESNKDKRKTLSYMEESLIGIGTTLTTNHDGVALYVVDHDLADLPMNLLRVPQFGEPLAPAASVPSLTWLHGTLRQARTPTGRCTAWFLPPSEKLLFSPLAILRDNLGEDLIKRGFDVITDVDLPSAYRGSDLAIVGAHGSIWFDKGIFRAVADDEKLIRYSMNEFAARLSGTAVVVLLVCSGGRLDRDRLSFGAVGLPYELLHRGCRAVVGSPWPLDVGMANRWAQHFVERWVTGVTLVEAVHDANEKLRQFRPDESHFLAMHVIGNPLERIPE